MEEAGEDLEASAFVRDLDGNLVLELGDDAWRDEAGLRDSADDEDREVGFFPAFLETGNAFCEHRRQRRFCVCALVWGRKGKRDGSTFALVLLRRLGERFEFAEHNDAWAALCRLPSFTRCIYKHHQIYKELGR